MPEKYQIINITDTNGNPRCGGRYPLRIGRICEKPQVNLGLPMFINYISNSDGSDYSGFRLTTSRVERISESGNRLTVETMNSVYEFEKVEE